MAGIDEIVRINQSTYAWSSSRFFVDGAPFEGIVGVDYEEKLDIKEVYAARPDGTSVAYAGNGKYGVPNCKIRMLKDSFEVFKALLAAGGALRPGLGSYGDALFTVMFQCVEPIIGSVPISAILAPCKVMGRREAREEGIEALVTEVDLKVLRIIEGTSPLWSLVRQL